MRFRAETFIVLALLILPLFVSAREKIASSRFPGVSSSVATEQSTPYNAQTLALVGVNTTVPLAQGGGSVEIVDTNALKSTQGPEGEGKEQVSNKSGNVSLYTVREGDSISLIAQMFNVSSNTIVWANDIKNNTIKPGDTLIILPVSGVRHKVKAGDTIETIAKKYNGDADKIRDSNDIAPGEILVVGTYITIPNGEVRATVTSKPRNTSTSGASDDGYFIRPLAGVRGKDWWRTQGIHGYDAVDLAAPEGTPVRAAASGTVKTAKADSAWNSGYGNYVIIKHPNGTQTLYAHFGAVLVGTGQQVVQGQTIGYIGLTGKTTGPHVHFEVRGGKNPF